MLADVRAGAAEEGLPGGATWEKANALSDEERGLFRTGTGGKVDRAIRRRDEIPESKVGLDFVRPNSAGSMERLDQFEAIVKKSGNESAFRAQVRDMLIGSVGEKLRGNTDPVQASKVVQDFIDKNSQALDRNSDVRQERFRLRNQLAEGQDVLDAENMAAKAVSSAERSVAQTQKTLQQSAFGNLIKDDPNEYIDSIMRRKDRQKQFDTIIPELKKDPEAMKGFKEALTRWAEGRIGSTNTQLVDGDTVNVVYSKFAKMFDDNRDTLAKVYSEEEMQALNRVQQALSRFGSLSRRATSGSDTTEKLSSLGSGTDEVVEAVFKMRYGMLKGAGLFKIYRQANEKVFGKSPRQHRSEELIAKFALDPEVAMHVLNAPARPEKMEKWVSGLAKLMNLNVALNNSGEED